jgi:hypothetical protein
VIPSRALQPALSDAMASCAPSGSLCQPFELVLAPRPIGGPKDPRKRIKRPLDAVNDGLLKIVGAHGITRSSKRAGEASAVARMGAVDGEEASSVGTPKVSDRGLTRLARRARSGKRLKQPRSYRWTTGFAGRFPPPDETCRPRFHGDRS